MKSKYCLIIRLFILHLCFRRYNRKTQKMEQVSSQHVANMALVHEKPRQEPSYIAHQELIPYDTQHRKLAVKDLLNDLSLSNRPRTPFEEKYPEYAKYFERIRDNQLHLKKGNYPDNIKHTISPVTAPVVHRSKGKPFSKSPKFDRRHSNRQLMYSNNVIKNNKSNLLTIPETFRSKTVNLRPQLSPSMIMPEQIEENRLSHSVYQGSNQSPTNESGNMSEASRTERELKKIESTLNVLSFTRDRDAMEDILHSTHDIVAGTVNGIEVLWDRAGNKLMVKDRMGLEENISSEGGVPFVLVQYVTDEGIQTQKMIVDDYVRR